MIIFLKKNAVLAACFALSRCIGCPSLYSELLHATPPLAEYNTDVAGILNTHWIRRDNTYGCISITSDLKIINLNVLPSFNEVHEYDSKYKFELSNIHILPNQGGNVGLSLSLFENSQEYVYFYQLYIGDSL
ncbi:hypothetical protein BdWA1_003069 [Babesia duncani]|uniref:Uncharacterized protein n=1 Tax=Babesia duncani TaxID=323732 RepID=A0AAD9PIG9_9APIC|nr:hypothetical protein BdWA1_003069 [Babesia duncani]